ncbi:MAG: alpha/beta hydrolase [Acidobacteriota bacterium]
MTHLWTNMTRQRLGRRAGGSAFAGVALIVAAACGGGDAVPSDAQRSFIDGLEAKFVDAGGVMTRYYDYGQGEVILLVHGGGMGGSSTANNWSRNIPGLAKGFRVIAVDRLAQGMTGNPLRDDEFTNQGTVAHIHRFLQTLQINRVHLVGHSSGGAVAFYFAIEHPEMVETLTVISHGPGMPPAGDGPTRFAVILEKCPPDTNSYEHRKCRLLALAHSESTFPPAYAEADDYMGNLPKSVEGRERMAAKRKSTPGWPDEQNTAYRARAWEQARNGRLQMPILLFTGKQDTLSWDADEPYAMHRGELGFFDIVGAKNSRVKLVIVNEAGHFPYREHPDQFNAALTQFIDFWNSHPSGS